MTTETTTQAQATGRYTCHILNCTCAGAMHGRREPIEPGCRINHVGGHSARTWCDTHHDYIENNRHIGR